ncbi:MAG: phage holin family protein [Thermoanaerobaculia bacterium]
MKILVRILLNGLGLWAAAQLLPGIHYSGDLWYLLIAGLVLGLVNLLVKPLITLLSLPLVLVTFGLFFLVINGVVLWLVDKLLDGLAIDSFLWAMLGGLFLAVWNLVLRSIFDRD